MGATSNPLFTTSAIAGTDVTKNRFVKNDAGGIVNRTTVAGEASDGVALHTVEAGAAASVQKLGVVVVEAGAIIAEGAQGMTDTVGRVITFAAGAGALALGKLVNGSSAGAAGVLVSFELYAKPVAIA